MTRLSLALRNDLESLAQRFARDGMVGVDGFLDEASAALLHGHLARRDDWREIIKSQDNVYDISREDYEALGDERRAKLTEIVHEAARVGFQFRYRTIRVADSHAERLARASLLDELALLLNAPETLDLLGWITGFADIAFIDAQATSFGAGDFLNAHDDNVAGKHRRAAYVLNLSPEWRPDWGGLLLFPDGDAVRGFCPKFNSLRIFAVPREHNVSAVAPFVTQERISVTGWLRTQLP